MLTTPGRMASVTSTGIVTRLPWTPPRRWFGARPGGLTLDVLLDNPHGVDLGPLESRLPEVLRTPTGMVELAPEQGW